MLRTGLVTVLLLGLGSTAMASDRIRVFVTYDIGGYYGVDHRYDDCRDGRRWSTRDDWHYYGDYRGWRPYPYIYYGWSYGWRDGRRDWDRRDDGRRHWHDRDDDWGRDGHRRHHH